MQVEGRDVGPQGCGKWQWRACGPGQTAKSWGSLQGPQPRVNKNGAKSTTVQTGDASGRDLLLECASKCSRKQMLGDMIKRDWESMSIIAEAGWWIFGGSLHYFFHFCVDLGIPILRTIFEENRSLSCIDGSDLCAGIYFRAYASHIF